MAQRGNRKPLSLSERFGSMAYSNTAKENKEPEMLDRTSHQRGETFHREPGKWTSNQEGTENSKNSKENRHGKLSPRNNLTVQVRMDSHRDNSNDKDRQKGRHINNQGKYSKVQEHIGQVWDREMPDCETARNKSNQQANYRSPNQEGLKMSEQFQRASADFRQNCPVNFGNSAKSGNLDSGMVENHEMDTNDKTYQGSIFPYSDGKDSASTLSKAEPLNFIKGNAPVFKNCQQNCVYKPGTIVQNACSSQKPPDMEGTISNNTFCRNFDFKNNSDQEVDPRLNSNYGHILPNKLKLSSRNKTFENEDKPTHENPPMLSTANSSEQKNAHQSLVHNPQHWRHEHFQTPGYVNPPLSGAKSSIGYGKPSPIFTNPPSPRFTNLPFPRHGNPPSPRFENPSPRYGIQQSPRFANSPVPRNANPQSPRFVNPVSPKYGNPPSPRFANPSSRYGNQQSPRNEYPSSPRFSNQQSPRNEYPSSPRFSNQHSPRLGKQPDPRIGNPQNQEYKKSFSPGYKRGSVEDFDHKRNISQKSTSPKYVHYKSKSPRFDDQYSNFHDHKEMPRYGHSLTNSDPLMKKGPVLARSSDFHSDGICVKNSQEESVGRNDFVHVNFVNAQNRFSKSGKNYTNAISAVPERCPSDFAGKGSEFQVNYDHETNKNIFEADGNFPFSDVSVGERNMEIPASTACNMVYSGIKSGYNFESSCNTNCLRSSNIDLGSVGQNRRSHFQSEDEPYGRFGWNCNDARANKLSSDLSFENLPSPEAQLPSRVDRSSFEYEHSKENRNKQSDEKTLAMQKEQDQLVSTLLQQCQAMVANDSDKQALKKVFSLIQHEMKQQADHLKSGTSEPGAHVPEYIKPSCKQNIKSPITPSKILQKLCSVEARFSPSGTSPDQNADKHSEMKFEGRTLLKGGVTPRHIPKNFVSKIHKTKPEDPRFLYPNYFKKKSFDIPLPPWAADIFGLEKVRRLESDHKEKDPDVPLPTWASGVVGNRDARSVPTQNIAISSLKDNDCVKSIGSTDSMDVIASVDMEIDDENIGESKVSDSSEKLQRDAMLECLNSTNATSIQKSIEAMVKSARRQAENAEMKVLDSCKNITVPNIKIEPGTSETKGTFSFKQSDNKPVQVVIGSAKRDINAHNDHIEKNESFEKQVAIKDDTCLKDDLNKRRKIGSQALQLYEGKSEHILPYKMNKNSKGVVQKYELVSRKTVIVEREEDRSRPKYRSERFRRRSRDRLWSRSSHSRSRSVDRHSSRRSNSRSRSHERHSNSRRNPRSKNRHHHKDDLRDTWSRSWDRSPSPSKNYHRGSHHRHYSNTDSDRSSRSNSLTDDNREFSPNRKRKLQRHVKATKYGEDIVYIPDSDEEDISDSRGTRSNSADRRQNVRKDKKFKDDGKELQEFEARKKFLQTVDSQMQEKVFERHSYIENRLEEENGSQKLSIWERLY